MGTDRRTVLLTQYETAWEMLEMRLAGLTDAEYFWEPVPGCWSVRRREEATCGLPVGKGAWVMDYDVPEPDPPPVTTIAWRICHLVLTLVLRHNHTFGDGKIDLDALVWPATAGEAFAGLTEAHTAWRGGLAGLTETDLDTVGLSTMPYYTDAEMPFADVWAWENTEFTHHAAEIALLRDLYRTTPH